MLRIPTLHHFQLVSSSSHFVLCPSFPICKADWPWQLIQADAVRLTHRPETPPPPHHWWTLRVKTTSSSNSVSLSFSPTLLNRLFSLPSILHIDRRPVILNKADSCSVNSIDADAEYRIRFGGGLAEVFLLKISMSILSSSALAHQTVKWAT